MTELLAMLGDGPLTVVGVATIHAHLLALSRRLGDYEHRLERLERMHVSPLTHDAALQAGAGMADRLK